jgi:hypothetical protein
MVHWWVLVHCTQYFIKYKYKMLELRIKCKRFENIYNCSAHTNISDWLKAIRIFKKKGETQIW